MTKIVQSLTENRYGIGMKKEVKIHRERIIKLICLDVNGSGDNISGYNSITVSTIIQLIKTPGPHQWCLHLIVVVGFECSWDPESYAGGSVATGSGTHARQVKG
jgi:hypothetical protein